MLVHGEGPDVTPVKVLNCDTITQVGLFSFSGRVLSLFSEFLHQPFFSVSAVLSTWFHNILNSILILSFTVSTMVYRYLNVLSHRMICFSNILSVIVNYCLVYFYPLLLVNVMITCFFWPILSSTDWLFMPVMHHVHCRGHLCNCFKTHYELWVRKKSSNLIFHIFKSKNKHEKMFLCDIIIHTWKGYVVYLFLPASHVVKCAWNIMKAFLLALIVSVKILIFCSPGEREDHRSGL